MAWNRPSAANQQPAQKSGSKAPSKMRGVIAGAVVVVLGALCFFLFSGKSEAPRGKVEKGRGRIKEVMPAVAPKTVAMSPTNTVEKKEPYRDKDGNLWIEPGRPYIAPDAIKVHYPDREEPLEKVFKHGCNIQIAQMLSIQPGELVEQEVYGKGFDYSFTESIGDKIVINPDDDEQTKSIKQLVIDARKEIIARVKQGETPSQIMTDTWEELYVLGRFRQDLKDQLLEMSKNGEAAGDDAADMIAAADKMLEQKGLPPIKNKRLLERSMKFNATKAKEKTEDENE